MQFLRQALGPAGAHSPEQDVTTQCVRIVVDAVRGARGVVGDVGVCVRRGP